MGGKITQKEGERMAGRREIPLEEVPGIGPARAKKLEKLGLRRLSDLLDYFPARYEDRRAIYTVQEAPEGEACCISALIAQSPVLSRIRKGLELVKVQAVDGTGVLHLTFFNQPYLKNTLRPGETYVFFGRVEVLGRRRSMTNPVFEREGTGQFTGRILPVYPLTAGINNRMICELAQRAAEVGVGVSPLSICDLTPPPADRPPALILGYTRVAAEDMAPALSLLKSAWGF